jgi:hypothetical protein
MLVPLRHKALIIATVCSSSVWAQLGGSRSFLLLDIPSSARIGALGGSPVAVYDNDLNLGLFNPGLLNKGMERQVALSYLPYVDKINIGYASYCHHFDSLGITGSASLQYVDYGTFTRTDETGQELGTFTAGEYVAQIGGAMPLDTLFRLGVNIKYVTSQLEEYRASAVAFDIGGVFVKQALGLTVAATLRNIGFTTSNYTDTKEKLPFQAQLAATYKFKHAPFRLGISFDNLQRWDLTYDDPTTQGQIDPTTGELILSEPTGAHKAMLHVVPNVEVLFGKNFMLRFGYDYRRRHELRLDEKPGMSGICFGLGLRVAKIHLSYGYYQFNVAGASNAISLAVRFNDFKKAEKPAGS